MLTSPILGKRIGSNSQTGLVAQSTKEDTSSRSPANQAVKGSTNDPPEHFWHKTQKRAKRRQRSVIRAIALTVAFMAISFIIAVGVISSIVALFYLRNK